MSDNYYGMIQSVSDHSAASGRVNHTTGTKNCAKGSALLRGSLLVGVALGISFTGSMAWAEKLEDEVIRYEVNATDQDAGIQIFFDGDGWKNVKVFDPKGKKIFDVKAGGSVKDIGGGTELFTESEEPEYEDPDELQDLLDVFREGKYRFRGKTVEGKRLTGSAELTQVIPAEPEIVQPLPSNGDECGMLMADAAVIMWNEVTQTIFGDSDIEIVNYEIIVENDETERAYIINLTEDARQTTVSKEFFDDAGDGDEYDFEILAREKSGNQTITESCFEIQII